MSLVIESGVRDGNRLAVFDDRMKEIEIQQSATNYFSTRQLNGRTGVFTTRNILHVASFSNTATVVVFSITNNDPINLLLIDRIYIQIPSIDITLPNSGFIASIINKSGSDLLSGPPIIPEKRYSNIIPTVRVRNIGNAIFTPIISPIIFFPTGDAIEFIPQMSNGIILPGSPINSIDTISNNSIAIMLSNNTGAAITNVNFLGFIRFMMVPPDLLG